MKIGQAATEAGISARMVRYYERIGLLQRAARTDGNYRDFDSTDVATLRFIAHSRALGFDLDEIRELLSLRRQGGQSAADVRALAQRHVALIDGRLAELTRMRAELANLIHCCATTPDDECPILDALDQESTTIAQENSSADQETSGCCTTHQNLTKRP